MDDLKAFVKAHDIEIIIPAAPNYGRGPCPEPDPNALIFIDFVGLLR